MKYIILFLLMSTAANAETKKSLHCDVKFTLFDGKAKEDFCFNKKLKITTSLDCQDFSCKALTIYQNLKKNKPTDQMYSRKTCEDINSIMIVMYDKDKNEYCFCGFDDLSKIDCQNVL